MASLAEEVVRLLGEKSLAKQEGRVTFQKVAFLLMLKRNSKEYPFLWGLRGPYSATLSEDMHEVLASAFARDLTPSNEAVLHEISALQGHGEPLQSSKFLEVVASYAYLRRWLNVPGNKAVEVLLEDTGKRDLVEQLLPDETLDVRAGEFDRLFGEVTDKIDSHLSVGA